MTFLPSHDAFAWTNAWPHQPAVRLSTPFGRLALGDASAGLCGGMVFAALDYWHAHVPPPSTRPSQDDPAYAFVVQRLVDSWHLPAGVAQYYEWMNLPDADQVFTVLGHRVVAEHGLAWRTLAVQWPSVRADLDRGVPSPLGLVTVRSASPKDLALNHQVLAWGYRTSGPSGSDVVLQVYDPNTGPSDDVTIAFDATDTEGPATFTHTLDIAHPVRGFFRTAYAPATPPA